MARYASVDQLVARYPTLSAGKDRGELANILTQASSDVDQYTDRSFNLRYRVEILNVSSPGTGAIGPRSQWYDMSSAEGWMLDSARPPSFFLKYFPIVGIDTVDVIFPTGDSQPLLVERLTHTEEGWVQLPAGVYLPLNCQLRVAYWNGYAAPVLTQDANIGDLTLHVDNMRGLIVAQMLTSLDGEDGEEVQLAAAPTLAPTPAVQPGALTLIEPLQHFHAAGTMFTGLPTNVVRATLLLGADTLEQDNRADPATFAQGVTMVRSGDMEMRREGKVGPGDLAERAYRLLERYKRAGAV